MYRQVLKDKAKIEETVAKLDEYKKEALQTTWEKVNEFVSFRAISCANADAFDDTASSATSSQSYCPATSRSYNRLKEWTSRRALRSRCGWVQFGRRA